MALLHCLLPLVAVVCVLLHSKGADAQTDTCMIGGWDKKTKCHDVCDCVNDRGGQKHCPGWKVGFQGKPKSNQELHSWDNAPAAKTLVECEVMCEKEDKCVAWSFGESKCHMFNTHDDIDWSTQDGFISGSCGKGQWDIVCKDNKKEWPSGCEFSELTGLISPNMYHSSPGGEIQIWNNPGLTSLPTKLFTGISAYHISIKNNANLAKLSSKMIQNTEALFFTLEGHPKMKSLPVDLFKGFTHTNRRKGDVFRVSNNGITALPTGMFDHTAYIGAFYWMNNKITVFQKGLFNGLTGGGILIRGEKELKTIEAGAYTGASINGGFEISGCTNLEVIEKNAFTGCSLYNMRVQSCPKLRAFYGQENFRLHEFLQFKAVPELAVVPGKADGQSIKEMKIEGDTIISGCSKLSSGNGFSCSTCKQGSRTALSDSKSGCESATTTITTTTTTSTTVTTLVECGQGTFIDVRSNSCKDCPEGTYQDRRNHQFGSCSRHGTCGKDEHVLLEGTKTTPTKCGSQTKCDADTQYESKAPSSTDVNGDRECTELSVCPLGSYVSTEPTSKSNRECEACDSDAFEFSAKENQKGSCSTFTTCTGENQRVVVAGTASSDLECGPCGVGYLQDVVRGGHRFASCKETTTTVTTVTSSTTTYTTRTGTTTTTTTTTSKTSTATTRTDTTTTTTTTTATGTSTTVTTTTNTDTTTTIPIAELKENGVSAKDLHRTHGASAADLAEVGFTVDEVADAGLDVKEIAAAADIFEDVTDATAADFQAVRGMTADMLKDEGFGALELLQGGFDASQLADAGYSDAIVSAASTSYADSLKNPNAATNTVVVAAVVIILLVVVAAAFIVHKKKVVGNGGGGGVQAGFENPMYDSNQPTGTRTFMDTSPQASSGYMDVSVNSGGSGGGGGGGANAYMDVSPTPQQQHQQQGGGSAAYMDVSASGAGGGDGFESSDEEV